MAINCLTLNANVLDVLDAFLADCPRDRDDREANSLEDLEAFLAPSVTALEERAAILPGFLETFLAFETMAFDERLVILPEVLVAFLAAPRATTLEEGAAILPEFPETFLAPGVVIACDDDDALEEIAFDLVLDFDLALALEAALLDADLILARERDDRDIIRPEDLVILLADCTHNREGCDAQSFIEDVAGADGFDFDGFDIDFDFGCCCPVSFITIAVATAVAMFDVDFDVDVAVSVDATVDLASIACFLRAPLLLLSSEVACSFS